MSSFYNDGLGLSTIGGDSSSVFELQSKVLLIDLDIANLNTSISNLDPSDVSGTITALQNADVSFATSISNLSIGYSNNSNLIANFEGGSNYDAEILALQNKDINLDLNIASLNTGISNNATSIANIVIPDYDTQIQSLIDKDGFLDLDVTVLNSSISNLITKDTSLDTDIVSLQTKDNALDTDILALQTKDISLDGDIASLIAKDASLDLNVNSLNAGVSNLSVLSSNYATSSQLTADLVNVNAGYSNNNSLITNLTIKESGDTVNLNAGISNLSGASSNYVNLTGLQTITNKTMDYALNTFIGFPSGGSGGSNYDIEIADLQEKDTFLDLDIGMLNTGYSNNFGLINNLTTITTDNTTSLNAGISNNTSSISTLAIDLNFQIAKEAIDVGFLNTGISNNTTSISTLSTKQIDDVNSLNAVSSNLSTLSSNYATLTGIQTLTGKTIDANLNTFLNLPSGGGGSGSPLSYKNGIISNPDAGTGITYTHGLGTTPSRIKFEAKSLNLNGVNGGLVSMTQSFGTYDSSGNKCIGTNEYNSGAGASGNSYDSTSHSVILKVGAESGSITGTLSGTVTAVNSTTFTMDWVVTGDIAIMNDRSILWSAQGGGGAGTNDPLAVETFTNKTMSFSDNTFTSFPYSIAPTTHLANYIPKWNGTADSKTLVQGVVAPSGDIVGTTDVQTLTGKNMDFNANNFTNFPSGGGGGGSEFTTTSLKTADYTAVSGDEVIIDTNSATANVLITLPATPTVGNIVRLVLITEHATRVVNIGRNGSPIDGYTATEGEVYHTLWKNGDTVTFKFLGGATGWSSVNRNIKNRFIGRAYSASYLSNMVSGTITKLQIDTRFFDFHGSWNTTLRRFDVPISGTYQFIISFNWDFPVINKIHRIYLYKNGVGLTNKTDFPSLSEFWLQKDIQLVNLVAGDYIEVYALQVSGNNTKAIQGTVDSGCSSVLVSRI